MSHDKTGSSTLQHAASVVFALTAVLPLLVFAWTLYRVNALSRPQAQLGLGLALGAALLGWYIFRALTRQMSELIRAVGNATELAARSAADAQAHPAMPRTHRESRENPRVNPIAQGPQSTGAGEGDRGVLGIGTIQEVRGLTQAMAALWKTEATALKGRRVLVSVMNSPQPIAGTLVDVTEDGLLIERDVGAVGVTYRRISAIDAERTSGEKGACGHTD